MNYRKFQADKIFTGFEFLDPGHVLIMDVEGKVKEIVAEMDAGDGIERYRGIICPGFINAHCHLELSHLKNTIPPHTGLIPFLLEVVTKRTHDQALMLESIEKAEREMEEEGIVAVGDICNTNITLETKRQSKIKWNNFIEVLGMKDEKAEANLLHYEGILETFTTAAIKMEDASFKSSLVPHAPYSISNKTFEGINNRTSHSIVSMHSQENPSEDELYKKGTGDFIQFFNQLGLAESPFPVTGKSSLRSCLPHFNKQQRMILVHNTFTAEEDIVFALDHAKEHLSGIHFCLCVNANRYIENRMPPIDILIKNMAEIILGTDSYSSNWQLSIASEIRTIRKEMPAIPLQLILQWATINGARALERDDVLGSFEPGKKPGIVLLDSTLQAKKII
jgi:cytosine/adenosine deaminase-related metal-dependent hydrolase